MKKIFLLFILFLGYFSLLNAQNDFSPRIGLGGHYGYGYANVRFKPSIRSNSIETNNYGLVFYYISEKHLGIQLEVNITERGWESGSDTSFYNERRMRYLDFPLLSNINVGGKHFRFTMNAGPYLAFFRQSFEGFKVGVPLADSERTITNSPYEYQEQYFSQPQGKLDYGYTLGAEIGFYSSLGNISLRFRYTQGLTNLFPQYPEGTFKFSQMRTYSAGISYTYEFWLKPKNR